MTFFLRKISIIRYRNQDTSMTKMHLEFTDNPSQEEIETLTHGIAEHAKELRDLTLIKPFGFFYKNTNNTILAGCNGILFYGSMFIDQLWVDKKLRNQGLGTLLMQKAEQFAKDTDCSMITVNTMDWEALDFYKKLGFKLDFERSGYAKGSKMYFLRKTL